MKNGLIAKRKLAWDDLVDWGLRICKKEVLKPCLQVGMRTIGIRGMLSVYGRLVALPLFGVLLFFLLFSFFFFFFFGWFDCIMFDFE